MEKTLDQVNRFFEGYANAFDHAGLDHLLECYHYPCLVIFGERISSYTSKDQLLISLRQLFGIYQKKGYKKASFKVEALSFFNPANFLVTVHWSVLDEAGKTTQFAITYQMVALGDRLQIVVVTNLEEKL